MSHLCVVSLEMCKHCGSWGAMKTFFCLLEHLNLTRAALAKPMEWVWGGRTICLTSQLQMGGVFRETCLKTGMIFADPCGDGSGVENGA